MIPNNYDLQNKKGVITILEKYVFIRIIKKYQTHFKRT